MLQILYIIAFATLSILAVVNLIGSMISLAQNESEVTQRSERPARKFVPHPEFLDEEGNLIDEPLLVMRSISFDDARSRLDAIYESSPSSDS